MTNITLDKGKNMMYNSDITKQKREKRKKKQNDRA